MSVNKKMKAIADAIRNKTKETEPLTLDAMAEKIPFVYDKGYVSGNNDGIATGEKIGYSRGYDEGQTAGYANGYTAGHGMGFEEGKKAEYDAFWEVFQKGGVPMNYNYAFAYNKFKDDNYFPKYDIDVLQGNTTANYMFTASPDLTDTKVTIDASEANNTQNMFSGCTSLKKIPKLIVGANTTFSNTFAGCTSLEEINIEGTIAKNGLSLQYSTFLKKASIKSIIEHLSDSVSGLSVTFSKIAVNREFGIDVDDPLTYPEGSEYYNLRQSKSKWTINYA